MNIAIAVALIVQLKKKLSVQNKTKQHHNSCSDYVLLMLLSFYCKRKYTMQCLIVEINHPTYPYLHNNCSETK